MKCIVEVGNAAKLDPKMKCVRIEFDRIDTAYLQEVGLLPSLAKLFLNPSLLRTSADF